MHERKYTRPIYIISLILHYTKFCKLYWILKILIDNYV